MSRLKLDHHLLKFGPPLVTFMAMVENKTLSLAINAKMFYIRNQLMKYVV